MDWITNLFFNEGVAQSILLISMTIAFGLMLGKIKIFGISLGVTFILFVGIFLSAIGMQASKETLHFFQEMGLILFVFSIGLQVGPSFFANFRKGGAKLNLLATCIVLLGAVTTLIIHYATGTPISTMVGVMSGAITNTPGLGAAQQAYVDVKGVSDPSISLGYAVAYPLGVVGIILSLIVLRMIFRVNLDKEQQKLDDASAHNEKELTPLSLVVNNPSVFGKSVSAISQLLKGSHFVVSRIYKHKQEEVFEVGPDTILEENDKVFVIAPNADVEAVVSMIGYQVKMDRKQWIPTAAKFTAKRIVITKEEVNGRTLEQLNLRALYGVTITRVERSGFEFLASPSFRLQYGDVLTIVGSDSGLTNVRQVLGDREKHLNDPNLISIFLGIVLGVILGSVPIFIPGIPQPLKLGLAGGPLIVAILLSSFGYKYRLITYTTASANLMLREVGISSFLACVGLAAGGNFVDTIVNKGGYIWILYGFLITVIPLLLVGAYARGKMKMNFLTLMGLIAGSTTDPPALAYASSHGDGSAAQLGYATVYPLTMFLRVIVAQVMILFFL